MPKRKCPFDTNLSQQLKIHISQKKFEERNDFAMNKIHDKTLDLLFQGARNLYKSNKINDVIHNNLICHENTKDFCVVCNDINTVIYKCKHCDRCLCQQCLTHCIICNFLFCKFCSVKRFIDNNNDGYCLSCCTIENIEL